MLIWNFRITLKFEIGWNSRCYHVWLYRSLRCTITWTFVIELLRNWNVTFWPVCQIDVVKQKLFQNPWLLYDHKSSKYHFVRIYKILFSFFSITSGGTKKKEQTKEWKRLKNSNFWQTANRRTPSLCRCIN